MLLIAFILLLVCIIYHLNRILRICFHIKSFFDKKYSSSNGVKMRGKSIFDIDTDKSIEVRVESDKCKYGDIYYIYDGYQQIIMIGSYVIAKKYLEQYSTTIRKYDYLGYVFQKLFKNCIGANYGANWLTMKKPLNVFFNRAALEKNFPTLILHIRDWITSNIKCGEPICLNSIGFDILTLKIMSQIVYGGLNDVLFNELLEIYNLHQKVMKIMAHDMILRLNIYPTQNSRVVDSLRDKWLIFNNNVKSSAELKDLTCPYGDKVKNDMNVDSLFTNMVKMDAYNSIKLLQTLYEIVLFNADIMLDAFVNVFTNISQSNITIKRICKECEQIDVLTDYRQIDGLFFLACVINESARLNPGIVQTFAETITQPINLGHFQCSAGTKISLDTQMLNRDPDIWEHPHEFNPDRFSGTDSKKFYKYHRFGLGPRMCLGNIYADYVLKSVVVLVLDKFDLEFVNINTKQKEKNSRISLQNMSENNLNGNLMFLRK